MRCAKPKQDSWRLALQALLLAVLAIGTVQIAAAESKPNIIVIFCDDLGYGDIGPFGAEHHRTPNIDKMAKGGIKLTNFYSTCCVCTPSRSSLMTGCYPKRIGMHQNETGGWVLFPGNKRGLNPSEITMAEVLKDAGYATAIVGKWHLGDQPEYLPTRQGFDSYFGVPFSNDMGKTDRRLSIAYPPTPLLRNEKVIELEPNQRFITRRYTEEALQFIETNKEQPFFLYLPHSMPHWPQYASRKFAHQSANKAWGDAVEEIDWSTGQIFKQLQRLDLDDNTLVVFTSDNGGASQHGAVNKPLRGGKGSTWEGGQRVCCVVRWPGKIPANTSSDALTVTMDLMPTFAKLAGGKVPDDRTIDGKDIGPILMGETNKTPHEQFYYYFRDALDAVRHGDWKLIVKQKGKPIKGGAMLFNLADDIAERNNVVAEHPEVVAKLEGMLTAARKDLGDGKQHAGSDLREPGHVEQSKTLTASPPNELVQTDVFTAGEDGYHTYRIPTLITTARGSLLAICEGRRDGRGDHGNLDLVAKRSDDMGATWSDMSLVYEEGGEKDITIGNPCPVVDQETGTIWLPFCRNNDTVFMTHSTDDGKTWAKPVEITSDVKLDDWGWYATGPGVGIQMTRGKFNGRMVIPCDHREKKNGKWIKMSHAFYSDDHGESWKLGGTVNDHTDECQVVELHDGRLMMNMRNYWKVDGGKPDWGGKRAIAFSSDGGESWDKFGVDETLIEPICQASLVKHSDDAFRAQPLFFSNPASTNRRVNMTVRISTDHGKTWSHSKQLCDGPAAYSCLSVLPDRSVGCLYETGEKGPYEQIRFARFSTKWLLAD